MAEMSMAEMSIGRNVRDRNVRGRNVLAETSVAEMSVAEMTKHQPSYLAVAAQFVLDLVRNTEDRFSGDRAHMPHVCSYDQTWIWQKGLQCKLEPICPKTEKWK